MVWIEKRVLVCGEPKNRFLSYLPPPMQAQAAAQLDGRAVKTD
jgi:hypothetical protein